MVETETPIELTEADLARSYLYHELVVVQEKIKITFLNRRTKLNKLRGRRDHLEQYLFQLERGDDSLITGLAALERTRREQLIDQSEKS